MSMFIIERKKNFFNMLAYVHQRRTNVIIISQQGLIQRITRVNKFAYKFSAACEASSPANTQVFRCFFLSPFFYMVGKLYLFPSPQLFCFDFFFCCFLCVHRKHFCANITHNVSVFCLYSGVDAYAMRHNAFGLPFTCAFSHAEWPTSYSRYK